MKWQPIEHAPKDGTSVLLWFPEGHWLTGEKAQVGFWYEADIGNPDSGWYWGEADSKSMTAFGDHPSHWMPLPDPPSE